MRIKRYIFLKNPISYFKVFRLDLFLAWFFFKPYTFFRLMIDFIRIRPQIVNLHFPDYQLVECYLLQKLFRFKLIMSLHGDEVVRMERLNKSTLRYFLYKDLFTSSIYITGCSKYLLDKFHNIFPSINRNKCITLLNGVNENFIYQSLNENKSNYIFSAGRFVHKKGFDLLFEAIKHLKDFDKGLQIVIFGQNKPKNPIDFNFPVNYSGFFHDDISLRLFYSSVDLMIVPSRTDTLNQVAIESMSCATPVVAFGATGLLDIVDHKINGYLAKPFEIEDLANGIKYILDAPNYDELCDNARQKIIKTFDNEVVTKQYIELYKSILK